MQNARRAHLHRESAPDCLDNYYRINVYTGEIAGLRAAYRIPLEIPDGAGEIVDRGCAEAHVHLAARAGSLAHSDDQGRRAVLLIKAVHGSKMSSTKLISRNWGSARPMGPGTHRPAVLTVGIGSRHRMTQQRTQVVAGLACIARETR